LLIFGAQCVVSLLNVVGCLVECLRSLRSKHSSEGRICPLELFISLAEDLTLVCFCFWVVKGLDIQKWYL
jgi:hypothetical protein